MKKLKGKCKKCIGCNKIFENGFAGRKKCKYFNRKNDNKEIIIGFMLLIVLEIVITILVMFFLYNTLLNLKKIL